ncbi:MAG: aspartate kinase [Clostridia bacterium]|nr:aspartate kinase [Clostridia bacterium]
MSIVVQKYGGTSVATKENLEKICEKIIAYASKKIKLVIVVSAQGKTTDHLIAKANDYSNAPNKRDLDLLLTTGEIQTASLLSMMLNERGYDSVSLTGYQAGILSDSTYGNANIKHIYTENILNYLNSGYIVVVAGFQAIDKLGNITTLGRGGSDLSAVAIASALKANKCEIYSDIDGIYSADPRIISKAKLLKKISYNEMLEAASAGAKVLHNRSVNVGKKYQMPIYVKNAVKNSNGSLVTDDSLENPDVIENKNIKFITKKEDIAKICIVGDMIMSNKKAITKIFSLADEENVTIYMISFSELALNIIIDKDKSESFMKKLHSILIEEETK